MIAINEAIMANMPVQPVTKDLESARREGAMALFGEKYGDEVRTVTVGDLDDRYSYELCGGTHVSRTAEIGSFVITSEGSAAAGIRRIEAVTGLGAAYLIKERLRILRQSATLANTTVQELPERIHALQDELHTAQRLTSQLRRAITENEYRVLLTRMEQVGDVPVLAAAIPNATVDNLREMADRFRDQYRSGVVALGTVIDNRPQMIVAVTDDLVKRGVHAGNLIKVVAGMVGGGGGGRPNMAQAGGKDAAKLPEALARVPGLVRDSLNQT